MCINWHFIYIHAYALLHPFRYARCTRVDAKHAMLEPNHKTVFDGHLQKLEGTAEATEDPAQGRKGPGPKIILTLT